MSDRIGVFNRGRLEQIDTPTNLYEKPATRFVAEFLGAANVLEAEAAMQLTSSAAAMIRPERIRVGAPEGARLSGTVSQVQYFGSFWRVKVDGPANLALTADLSVSDSLPALGETLHLHWDESAVHRLSESGSA